MKRLLLMHPLANEGKSKKTGDFVSKVLKEKLIDLTTIPDLSKYIKQESPDTIVVSGGDGTVNLVASAVLKSKIKTKLAVIPLGFGNVLSYLLNVDTVEKALLAIKNNNKTLVIDVMKTDIPKYPYGIINIGLGFDGRVVHNRKNFKYIGLRSYFFSGLHGIVNHVEKEMTILIDNKLTIQVWASSLVIAKSPVIGKNLIISPDASLNDGLLDCTIFSTKYDYITNLRFRGFKHPFYSTKGKVHFKAKHIKIIGEPYYQVDGDPGISEKGISVSVLPKKLTFLCN